jgi:hypothetical protein
MAIDVYFDSISQECSSRRTMSSAERELCVGACSRIGDAGAVSVMFSYGCLYCSTLFKDVLHKVLKRRLITTGRRALSPTRQLLTRNFQYVVFKSFERSRVEGLSVDLIVERIGIFGLNGLHYNNPRVFESKRDCKQFSDPPLAYTTVAWTQTQLEASDERSGMDIPR